MKRKPSALVIFSPAFPKDAEDTEWLPWLQLIVKAINRNFPSLTVVVFAFQYPHHVHTYKWGHVSVIPFNGMHRTKTSRMFMWARLVKEFSAVKRQYDVQGIFSLWCGECTVLAKICGRLFNVSWYCWVIGGDARPGNKSIRWIKPMPQRLVAMSDFLSDQFYTNYGIRPARIITNGVEPAMYGPLVAERNIDVIGVGGFSTLKRYDIFVQAVAQLKRHIPHIRAVLCGSGAEMEARIHEMRVELGLQNNLELPGYIKHKAAIEKMENAKILLHPSSYEGFSSVCLEALYAGAHVISFIKPMQYDIPNWHIVHTGEEMAAKALALLQAPVVHERVLVKTIDDISTEIVQLFGMEKNN